jgi:TetR/AcrR family transcriptional regulator, cholesterol catabolism regulator
MPSGVSGAPKVVDVSTTNPDRATVRPGSKSERTRERIILAAAVTLSRLGYAGTRLSDVADEAGVQAPAIYYYFDSREELIEEVVTVGTVHLREFVIAAVDSAPPDATALDRIDIAVEAHLRQLMSESSFAHAVIRNVGQLPDSIRSNQLIEERKYVRFWRQLFLAARDEGALRADVDPELAQLLLVGALNWATEWWTPKRGPLEKVIATAQAIVRHGIEADRPG